MKLIDEKGRLFGRINIVDFSIILFFLVVIPAFFYIYEVLGKRPTRVPYAWIKVETVTFTIPEFAELFKPGDIAYDNNGCMDGKLLKITAKEKVYSERLKTSIMEEKATVLRKDGESFKLGYRLGYEYRIPVFLELELLCTRSSTNKRWYYRREPILVSLDHAFWYGTAKYSTLCYVIKIYESNEQ